MPTSRPGGSRHSTCEPPGYMFASALKHKSPTEHLLWRHFDDHRVPLLERGTSLILGELLIEECPDLPKAFSTVEHTCLAPDHHAVVMGPGFSIGIKCQRYHGVGHDVADLLAVLGRAEVNPSMVEDRANGHIMRLAVPIGRGQMCHTFKRQKLLPSLLQLHRLFPSYPRHTWNLVRVSYTMCAHGPPPSAPVVGHAPCGSYHP
jgi:hypothetical protein